MFAACARTLPDTVSPDELAMGAPPGGGPTRIAEVAPEPPAVLTRTVLTHAVERGFPWFLVRIEVSPVLQAGRFVGYRLDAARDLRRWNEAGLDLHVGDVVTRVNGGSIERPDAAIGVFQAMRDAQEVTVDVVREGRAVTLRVPVGAL